MTDVAIGNLIILLGGLLTWTSRWLLIRKDWRGWVLSVMAIFCYTVAPLMMGLWTAIIVNGVTLAISLKGAREWYNAKGY